MAEDSNAPKDGENDKSDSIPSSKDESKSESESQKQDGKNKRRAEVQLTKDDVKDEGEDENGSGIESGSFSKASEETLAKRKIIRAKRPSSTNTDANSSNPFAAALSGSGSGNVFGSGFGGGFGVTKTSGGGFGFANKTGSSGLAANATTGFGSAGGGFGTAPSASPSIFGNSNAKSLFSTTQKGIGGVFTAKKSERSEGASDQQTKAILPENVKVENGEEGEECIFEIRVKSFLLVDVDEKPANNDPQHKSSSPITMSVPPSSANAPSKETAAEKTDKPQEGKSAGGTESSNKPAPSKDGEASESANKDDASKKNGDEFLSNELLLKQKWQELGIGPLKVLKRDGATARVVQRRESAPGAMGTKLLVNAPLQKECKLTRPSEKHLQLATIEKSGKAMVYLFKVRNVLESKQLEDFLQKEISSASSIVK